MYQSVKTALLPGQYTTNIYQIQTYLYSCKHCYTAVKHSKHVL